jgi:hypothetical protein
MAKDNCQGARDCDAKVVRFDSPKQGFFFFFFFFALQTLNSLVVVIFGLCGKKLVVAIVAVPEYKCIAVPE